MLFIATENKLVEIPFDKNYPDFNIQKIGVEYPGIVEKFSNPNIYFAGTSRGCSCDFGMKRNTIDELNVDKNKTGIFAEIRKLFGTQEKYIEKRISLHSKSTKDKQSNIQQTEKLFEIIERETTTQNKTEMFYCWSGEYAENIEETQTIDLQKVKLSEVFDEFYERDKIVFIKGSH